MVWRWSLFYRLDRWIESAKGEKQPDTFRSSRWLRRSVEEPSNLDSEIRAGASEWRSAGAARARARRVEKRENKYRSRPATQQAIKQHLAPRRVRSSSISMARLIQKLVGTQSSYE